MTPLEEISGASTETTNELLLECVERDISLGGFTYLCKFSDMQENCIKCPYDYGRTKNDA